MVRDQPYITGNMLHALKKVKFPRIAIFSNAVRHLIQHQLINYLHYKWFDN